MRLRDRVAVVTGASRGIGRAIALRFLAEGALVVACARGAEGLRDLAGGAAAAGSAERLLTVPCDVTRPEDVERLARATLDRHGRVDILVNNAGVGYFAPVEELLPEQWDEMMGVNLKGAFLCCRAFVPVFKRQRSGHIINISSVAGLTAFEGGSGYCASKWGLMGLTETLLLELKPYEVKVSVICPGSVKTGFGGTPPRPYSLRPEDVADAVLEVAAAPRGVVLNQVVMRPLVPAEYQSPPGGRTR